MEAGALIMTEEKKDTRESLTNKIHELSEASSAELKKLGNASVEEGRDIIYNVFAMDEKIRSCQMIRKKVSTSDQLAEDKSRRTKLKQKIRAHLREPHQ